MRNHLPIVVLAAGLLLPAGFGQNVLAAGHEAAATNGEDMFTVMDGNKDGILTKEEFAAHGMAGDFAKYDKNGDGKVTREEYDAVTAATGGKMPGM